MLAERVSDIRRETTAEKLAVAFIWRE